MRSRTTIRRTGRLAMAAVAVAGLVTATQSTAQAAPAAALAASVSASPAVGIVDGELVTVSVTGLFPEAMVGQCAVPGGVLVCNPGSMAQFPTDASGNGSKAVTVRKSFTGYTLKEDGSYEQWGVVTCGASTPCSISATDGVTVVTTSLTFR